MKSASILGILILGLVSLIPSVYAQPEQAAETSPENLEMLFDPQQGAGELSAIKAQIQALLEQNKELESQLEPVKKEFWDLREKVHSARARQADSHGEDKREQERLARLNEPQSLEQLKLYDLQYEKKELELELRLMELAAAQREKDSDARVAALRKELEQNTEAHKQVRAQIEELKNQGGDQSAQIGILKQENAALQEQLKSGQPAGKLVGAEVSGPAVGLWKSIRQKEREKLQLQKIVEELRAAKQLSPTAAVEGNFVDAIRQLDGENQQLRSRLFSLRQNAATP